MFQPLVDRFLSEREEDHRDASFDYCYAFFQAFREKPQELLNGRNQEMAAFHMAFYLASWGMFRGSSKLLGRSVKYFFPFMNVIANSQKEFWVIEPGQYVQNKELIFEENKRYTDFFKEHTTLTVLLTKIYLGVFGNLPAFDQYFRSGIRKVTGSKHGFYQIKEGELETLDLFYLKYKDEIDHLASKAKCLDLKSGKESSLTYSKAKIIDMIGFQFGLEENQKGNLKN